MSLYNIKDDFKNHWVYQKNETKIIAKVQNISKNDLSRAEKLQNKSTDELRGIARLRRLKKYDNLTKEYFIFRLVKSESNPLERNYMRYSNNSTNDEIKSKINTIRPILVD